jgi:plastocyanin
MTRRSRFALLGLVVVIAIVAFVIAQPGGDDNNTQNDGGNSKTGATAGPGPTSKNAVEPTEIRVKGGKPVGGIADITVSKGDRVRFAVTSDVADEVHVHGYDFMKDVAAGGTVRFDFSAKIDGSFEIELENRQEQIASLKVEP